MSTFIYLVNKLIANCRVTHRSIKVLLLKKMNKLQDILYFVKMYQNNV